MFNLFDRWRNKDEDEWFEHIVDPVNFTHLDSLVATGLPEELVKMFTHDGVFGWDPTPQEAFDYEANWREADDEWRGQIQEMRKKAWENIVRNIERDDFEAIGRVSAKEIQTNHTLDRSCRDYSFGQGFWHYEASYRLLMEYAKHREKLLKQEKTFRRTSKQWSFIKDKYGFWIAVYAAAISTGLVVWQYMSGK